VSKVGVAIANVDHGGGRVTADLDTLLTALYVLADDLESPDYTGDSMNYAPMTSGVGLGGKALPGQPLGVGEDRARHQSSTARPPRPPRDAQGIWSRCRAVYDGP